jgi:3'-phosphoadenosine 5'-phosphosulfate sulfotransferase (PAPS reductase)/FAD synthetase
MEYTIPENIISIKDNAKWIITFSGGKDSIAMYLHVKYNLGIDNSNIELHHHEVDGMENNFFDWPCTPSYCIAFAKHFDVPLFFSYRKGGIKREILRNNETLQSVFYQQKPNGEYFEVKSQDKERFYSTRNMFPAVSGDLRTRWCSSTVKIDVLSRLIANNPNYKSGDFIICTGERRSESAIRSKYAEVEVYRGASKKRNAILWRPVIDFSDNQVWELMKLHSIQPHPAYMLGWSRCSCMTCIFNSANTWATLKEINPIAIARIKVLESKIQHTMYHKMDIYGKANAGKSFSVKNDDYEYWKNQALGVFSAPIITNNWTLPLGANNKEKSGAN